MRNFFRHFLAVTRELQSISFWLFGLSGLIVGGIFGYSTGYILYETDVYNKYSNLDDEIKSAFSPVFMMLEIFLAACAPMMFLLGVKFFLLKINKDFKDYLFAALPFLPLLNKITGTPYVLMTCFSGSFFGIGLYLYLNEKGEFLMAGVYGTAMFVLAMFLRRLMVKPMSEETLDDFSVKNNRAMGITCWVFSLAFYLYGGLIRDLQNYINFIQWLSKSA
jgi:hypothetical protein